jgi:phosphoribosylanthranilate isomerase
VNKPLIKVCGLTREEDALRCAELGADLLGFIFHPGSPRNTTPEFPARLRAPGARKVGVFVGQSVMETLGIMAAGRLDLVQLHGGQDEAFCRKLSQTIGPGRIIKVFWPEKAVSLEAFQAELDRFAPLCALMLADAGSGGGGHGQAIAGRGAEILAGAKFSRPWLLAGGLGPDTVADMLSRFTPAGLDLNSGVESAPGLKDETKLRAAFDAINATGRAAQTKGVTP